MAIATTIAKAEVKYNTLLDMALSATQDMEEDSLYLDSASNEKISKLVQKISEYKKGKDKIKSTYNDYLEFTAVHKPDSISHDPKKLHSTVQKAISIADTLISELENEDEERGLYTLLPRKTERAKWPTFSGNPGESYFRFKEKFLKTARQNMTSKSDQFTKLRENLKDFPLTLVPESLDDISKAFDRLADTFGDPQKLANFELKKLEKVSMIPNCDDGSYTLCTRAQAEWLLGLETVIAELVKMANDDDADIDLTRSVFGPQTTSIILGKFPPVLKQRLVRAAKADSTTEKLITYQAKVNEWSKQALEMERYEPEVKTVAKKLIPQIQYIRDTRVNLFKPPKALPACIICVELQKKQPISPQLPHLSNHITGCPMFIEMNIITRNNISEVLKLCKSCLRLDSGDHEKTCMVLVLKNKKQNNGKTKFDFTCRDKFCFRHMWLCTKHKLLNQESMDAKAAQLENDHGFKLVHFMGSYCPMSSCSLAAGQSQGEISSTSAAETVNDVNASQPSVCPNTASQVFRTAEKNLKRKAAKSDKIVEVVPIPDGEPMFMFQALKGRTGPVNAFYDSGCSNACLRDGVPGVQLRGQMLAKGPFTVGGVNGITIQAMDEWLVHLDRVDGRKQQLRAVTLDRITGDSPIFSIEEATEAVKSDNPENQLLQNCCLPKSVGGVCDILIGILYNFIFPKAIHHLPSGLTIYKCVLASHDNSINATIGGPHTSFNILADQVGGAAPLMAHFLAGLEQFKRWGPPSIKKNPMSLEEERYAIAMNAAEGDSIFEELILIEEAKDYIEELLEAEEENDDSVQMKELLSNSDEDHMELSVCECNKLCSSLNQPAGDSPDISIHLIDEVHFSNSEKLSTLCKLVEDGGISIEYRCVRCRECSDCKNAEQTEKISLREEAEMHMIRESVKLDIPNKRIICSLPVRGVERNFLSTNRDRAQTVLDQQYSNYHGDKEVKEVVLKGFKKTIRQWPCSSD